jgi:hypothetical protein
MTRTRTIEMRAKSNAPRAPPQGDVRKPAPTSARRWTDPARISAVKPHNQLNDDESDRAPPPRRFERRARFAQQHKE